MNKTRGMKLRDLRIERGITVRKLSEEITNRGYPLSVGSISNYENDRKNPSSLALKALADYYEVSYEYLASDSQVRSTDLSIKDMSDKLGLSEKAILSLMDLKEDRKGPNAAQETREILNTILEKVYSENSGMDHNKRTYSSILYWIYEYCEKLTGFNFGEGTGFRFADGIHKLSETQIKTAIVKEELENSIRDLRKYCEDHYWEPEPLPYNPESLEEAEELYKMMASKKPKKRASKGKGAKK